MSESVKNSMKRVFAGLATIAVLAGCGPNNAQPPAAAAGSQNRGGAVNRDSVPVSNSAIIFHKVGDAFSKHMRGIDCDTGASWIQYDSSYPISTGSPAVYTPQGLLTLASYCQANGRSPGFIPKEIAVESRVLPGPRVVYEKIATPSGYPDMARGIDCDTGMSWTMSGPSSANGMSQTAPVSTTQAALLRLAGVCSSKGSTPGFAPDL